MGSLIATLTAALPARGAIRLVGVEEVTLAWPPAQGPVDGYLVFAAHDGGDFGLERIVAGTRATLAVEPDEEILVAVQAFGRGPDGTTTFGPPSEPSDLVRVERPPDFAATGLWTLRCAPCATVAFRELSDTRPFAERDAPGEGWFFAGFARPSATALQAVWWGPFQDMLALWDPASGRPTAYAQGSSVADYRPTRPVDLDGDGVDEMLLRHRTSGALEIRSLGDLRGGSGAVSLPASREARLVPADLDGDGRPELVWHDPATGLVTRWRLESLAIDDRATLGTAPATSTLVLAADLDGEGRDDLLWRAADGSLSIWYTGSGGVRATVAIASEEGDAHRWVVGAADFDGRPGAEIAVQDLVTGAVEVVYPLGGGRILALTPGSQWSVIDVRN